VNISYNFAFSDGLNAGEWEQMKVALGPVYRSRVVHRELLPLQYIEERLPEMLPVYRDMMRWVHETIATAFSNEVITPGVTRTQDVVWWMRQRVNDAGLGSWFQPSVSVQRKGGVGEPNPVILRGDVLHTDFGILALGLATDTQHMGYVLREGETDVPEGLKRPEELQSLPGHPPGGDGSGPQRERGPGGIVLERMREEGLNGTMYTHPIGDHGHGAGPLIGLWDRQEGVQGMGDGAHPAQHVVLHRAAGDHAGAGMGTGSRFAAPRRRKPTWTLRGTDIGSLPRQERIPPGAVGEGCPGSAG
jgi:hypothetical protein